MECKHAGRTEFCNCTYPCEKKGRCCDCIAYHRARRELPACYFTRAAEVTYDRSIANYIKYCSLE